MPVTPDQFANTNIAGSTTIAGGAGGVGTALQPTDTTLYVPTGQGARLPSVAPFMIGLGTTGLAKCTLRSGDTLTIVRGNNLAAPDTTGADGVLPVGTTVQQVFTAGAMSDVWTQIVNSGKAIYNVLSPSYGAKGDGATDDTAAINAAIAAGVAAGGYCVIYLPGTAAGYVTSAPLSALSATDMTLAGDGMFSTWIKPKSTFSGAQILSVTASNCTVKQFTIAYSSALGAGSGGNPAANGIQVTAARSVRIADVELRGLNGWAVQSTGTSTLACFDLHVDRVHVLHCANGGHTISDGTTQGYGGQQWWTDCNFEIVDTGDAMLVEDINDVWLINFGAAAAQGAATNQALHIKGACSSIHVSMPDVGTVSGNTQSAPVVLIESGVNGSPSGVEWEGGISQGGTTPLSITSGGALKFSNATFKKSNGDGAQVSGLTGTATFRSCTFKTNGVAGGTCYDLNLTTAANTIEIDGCIFESPIGVGANLITNPVNDTSHKGYFWNCRFIGSGTTPSNVFATTPQIVRNCVGYSPRGNITAPTIGASPFTSNTSQHDVSIIFTAINTLTAFKIGGTSVGVVPVAGVPYRVPARQSLEVDYSGAAPTWQWFAE